MTPQVRISNAARSCRRIRAAASASDLVLFAKICSRASRSACPLDVNLPDLFYISIASRAMVKVSSTYFSHLHCSPSIQPNTVPVWALRLGLEDASFLSPLSAVRCRQTAELDFGSCYAGGLILDQRRGRPPVEGPYLSRSAPGLALGYGRSA